MKAWKNSSSVILLAKNLISGPHNSAQSNFKILLQERSKKGSFASSVVFPGGNVDDHDSYKYWLDYYKSFGFDRRSFDMFQRPNVDLHPITLEGGDSIEKHVSLRITAIREAFEEIGILICKPRKNADKYPWASFMTDFDLQHWQNKVHNDPTLFMKLCEELDCYPDIWSLYLWSNWLTPIKSKQTPRHNTLFFIAAFEKQPPILIEESEVVRSIWADIPDVLDGFVKKEVNLMFPQWFELTRLKHQTDIDKLIRFAAERSSLGCDLFYPSINAATDGIVMALPGDDLYPKELDYINGINNLDGEKSMKEMRASAKVVHRAEMKHMNDISFSYKNFTPRYNHLSLCDGTIPEIPTTKSSL